LFLAIKYNSLLKITIIQIADKSPKPLDRDGFELRYIAGLDQASVVGATVTIGKLNNHFGKKTKGNGVYQATYEEVRAQLQVFMDEAPRPIKRNPFVRGAAGIAAVALMFAMGFCAVGGTMFWLVVCAFKRQSGLLTMAESAVVWRMLDWRPMIHYLVRIALGR
jgi:hypothetical protein